MSPTKSSIVIGSLVTTIIAGMIGIALYETNPSIFSFIRLKPREQRILRIWRGNPNDARSKGVCGIYLLPNEVEQLQRQGWQIKSSTPINYRINQKWYYYDCFGSEVVMEN